MKSIITDLPIDALTEKLTTELGQPRFRTTQVLKWLYQKRVGSFDAMTNIAKASRQRYAETFSIDKLAEDQRLESRSGDAVKFALRCGAGGNDLVECVLLYDSKRRTACLSSQLGCNLGCRFCATAKMGLIRNLSQYEILGQLIACNDYLAATDDKRVTNVVFMGMGEALGNFAVLQGCIEIITHPEAFNLAPRRITVSTAGLVPAIDRLAATEMGVGLAISLNTYNDQLRSRIMPINDRHPIGEVVAAARRYSQSIDRPVTFEYVVVAGENDTPEAVAALRGLLGRISCKINLIPVNPRGSDDEVCAPDEERLRRFARALYDAGLTATVRTSRGRDISGACGQLVGRTGPGE